MTRKSAPSSKIGWPFYKEKLSAIGLSVTPFLSCGRFRLHCMFQYGILYLIENSPGCIVTMAIICRDLSESIVSRLRQSRWTHCCSSHFCTAVDLISASARLCRLRVRMIRFIAIKFCRDSVPSFRPLAANLPRFLRSRLAFVCFLGSGIGRRKERQQKRSIRT